jgi:hypothetical protein
MPAIAIFEQRIIGIDQQDSFFSNNDFPRERDGSLSRFPIPALWNATAYSSGVRKSAQ